MLAYWDKLIRTDPDALQQLIEDLAARTDAPALLLYGDAVTSEQREYIHAHAPGTEVEEWPGGHMLHLVDPGPVHGPPTQLRGVSDARWRA